MDIRKLEMIYTMIFRMKVLGNHRLWDGKGLLKSAGPDSSFYR